VVVDVAEVFAEPEHHARHAAAEQLASVLHRRRRHVLERGELLLT